MKRSLSAACLLAVLLTACTQPATLEQVVGTDRDEHGCVGSAGYVWSHALHDCVRLWEAGQRFGDGRHALFLVYSADSTFAEVFVPEAGSVVCRRRRKEREWKARSGFKVFIRNGVTVVETPGKTYTGPTR